MTTSSKLVALICFRSGLSSQYAQLWIAVHGRREPVVYVGFGTIVFSASILDSLSRAQPVILSISPVAMSSCIVDCIMCMQRDFFMMLVLHLWNSRGSGRGKGWWGGWEGALRLPYQSTRPSYSYSVVNVHEGSFSGAFMPPYTNGRVTD